jgi:hypothetical protein
LLIEEDVEHEVIVKRQLRVSDRGTSEQLVPQRICHPSCAVENQPEIAAPLSDLLRCEAPERMRLGNERIAQSHLLQIQTYRGLSGIDTALFGLIVVDLFGRRLVERDWKAASWLSLLLIGLFAKMLTETLAGTSIFVSAPSFVPVPIAHLIGAVIGLIIGSASYAMIPTPRLRKRLASSSVDPGLWRSPGTRSEGEVVGKY